MTEKQRVVWPEEPAAKRWVLLRRFSIPCSVGVYLRRLRMVETPWFRVFLHRILAPDPDRHMHDHPWWFVSIVISGSYVERTRRDGRIAAETRLVRWLNVKRAADAHQIVEVRGRLRTLVVAGPRRRTWGFHTEMGWIPWHVYLGVRPRTKP